MKTITNGCGGKKGSKCYVEEYIMPHGITDNTPTAKKAK